MKRDSTLFLEDILESIKAIEDFSKVMKKEDLLSDRLKQSAIVREIEIIGEAVKNIPDSFTSKHPKIPWGKIAGMRDIVTHRYFRVDLDAVWNVIKKDLPVLKKQIQKISLGLSNNKTWF